MATAGEKRDERKGADGKGAEGKAAPPGGSPVKKGVDIDKPDPEAEEDL